MLAIEIGLNTSARATDVTPASLQTGPDGAVETGGGLAAEVPVGVGEHRPLVGGKGVEGAGHRGDAGLLA